MNRNTCKYFIIYIFRQRFAHCLPNEEDVVKRTSDSLSTQFMVDANRFRTPDVVATRIISSLWKNVGECVSETESLTRHWKLLHPT